LEAPRTAIARVASSFIAALLDGLFEQPAGLTRRIRMAMKQFVHSLQGVAFDALRRDRLPVLGDIRHLFEVILIGAYLGIHFQLHKCRGFPSHGDYSSVSMLKKSASGVLASL
jgi:hypothetical protein